MKSIPSEVFLTNKELELYVLNLLQDLQVFLPKEQNILIENHIYRFLNFQNFAIMIFQLKNSHKYDKLLNDIHIQFIVPLTVTIIPRTRS